MKRIVAIMMAALVTLSFSMVSVAVEKKPVMKGVSSAKKAVKKAAKKKDAAAKPAKKGKKEVSGC
jgi:cell division protein FtsL